MPNDPRRRLVENEQIAQKRNEGAKKALKNYFSPDSSLKTKPLEFYCECSDLTCRARIAISIDDYETAHAVDNQFVVIPGHNTTEIEKIVKHCDGYDIVQKYNVPV